MIRVLFLARSLEVGGAERQLIELARALDKERFIVYVATFYDGGALRGELERVPGVMVRSLGKHDRWDLLPFLWRLLRTAREVRPEVVYGYMDVANALALLAGWYARARVVWAVRSSNVDFGRYDWAARWTYRAAAGLSRFADLIVVNSWAGREHHVAQGFQPSRMAVVPNGIDTEMFRPDEAARRRVRSEWGVAAEELLVGHVGRLDPMKDHPVLLGAASRVVAQHPGVRFVCVGNGPEPYRRELAALARELGMEARLVWAGERGDMPAVYSALDLLVSSSCGEGFPNVVGEAMACGVPCVVTDVGDSARIVGDTGIVVPPGEPGALATGMLQALERCRDAGLRQQARECIVQEFGLERLVGRTEELLQGLLAGRGEEVGGPPDQPAAGGQG